MAIKKPNDEVKFNDIYENKNCDKCGTETIAFCSNQFIKNGIRKCKLSYIKKENK